MKYGVLQALGFDARDAEFARSSHSRIFGPPNDQWMARVCRASARANARQHA